MRVAMKPRARGKSDVQRPTAAVMTGTVETNRRSGAGRFIIVLRHARRHLRADGREHNERQAANEYLHRSILQRFN